MKLGLSAHLLERHTRKVRRYRFDSARVEEIEEYYLEFPIGKADPTELSVLVLEKPKSTMPTEGHAPDQTILSEGWRTRVHDAAFKPPFFLLCKK